MTLTATPAEHPEFDEDCDCDDETPAYAEFTDNRITLELITNLMTPRHVTNMTSFVAQGEYHSIESLMRQYRSLEDIPGADASRDAIYEEIRENIATLDSLDTIVQTAVQRAVKETLNLHPGIEIIQIDEN